MDTHEFNLELIINEVPDQEHNPAWPYFFTYL